MNEKTFFTSVIKEFNQKHTRASICWNATDTTQNFLYTVTDVCDCY